MKNGISFEKLAQLQVHDLIDITSYQNKTPLQYAQDRGYKAAASLIEEHNRTNSLSSL